MARAKRKDKETIDIESAIAESMALGYVEQAGTTDEGEPLYRLTERGRGYVEGTIEHSVPPPRLSGRSRGGARSSSRGDR